MDLSHSDGMFQGRGGWIYSDSEEAEQSITNCEYQQQNKRPSIYNMALLDSRLNSEDPIPYKFQFINLNASFTVDELPQTVIVYDVTKRNVTWKFTAF